MAETPILTPLTSFAGKKRPREEADDTECTAWACSGRFEKKARPSSGDSSISDSWSMAQDSVLNTPRSMSQAPSRAFPKRKYDSDDQSSMMSEPGSPQDIHMSDSGDDEDYSVTYSQLHTEDFKLASSPWQARMQANRVPTPILPPPSRLRTNHVRHRHPQEITSSELLEVPSPIDEDEVPTPPSAAEAAGSQLSMLTVNDMELEPSHHSSGLPTIAVEDLPFGDGMDSAVADEFDSMDSTSGFDRNLVVRKQRARSGALSSSNGSPVRAPEPQNTNPNGGHKRGFSMGFRADCERCQMRVPGHMNHYIS